MVKQKMSWEQAMQMEQELPTKQLWCIEILPQVETKHHN